MVRDDGCSLVGLMYEARGFVGQRLWLLSGWLNVHMRGGLKRQDFSSVIDSAGLNPGH